MTLNPVGYVWDGAIYHPECFPDDLIDPDDEEVAAIFSWEEDASTSICDVCDEALLLSDEGDEDEEEEEEEEWDEEEDDA